MSSQTHAGGPRGRVTSRNAPAGFGRGPGYRPALDGVRAIAVVSVMLYHAGLSWVPGGFLGVDVFFVLSGYLITTLLLDEWRTWGSLDLVGFYLRRARRLLPALALVVVAVAAWAALAADPSRMATIRGDGLSSLLYVSNWRFLLAGSSYFEQFGDPSPFRHTWSLAIEEQYYLFFPLLLIGLLRLARGRSWVVPTALGALAVASIVEMTLLFDPAVDPSRVYYGTDTRIHELMIGSLLGVLLARRRPLDQGVPGWLSSVAAPVGLVGTLVAMAWFHDQSPVLYRGGFAAVCLVAALLVLGVEAAPHGPVARLLSLRPVAWIGLISYGLYLWHWPVFIALSPAHVDLSGTALLIARLAATVMIATLSFYLVERPIRSGALRRVPAMLGRSVVVLGLPAALTALMLGTAGGQAAPLPDSPFGPNAAGAGNRSILVVGDSIGSSLSVSFPQPSFPSWKVADATHLGCGLAVQYLSFQGERGIPNAECKGQLERWGAAVTKVQPDVVLLSTGAWEVFDHVVGGKDVAATSASYASYLGRKYDQAYDTLTADGAMLVVPTVPCYDQQAPSLRGMDDAVVRNDPSRASAVNAVIADFADRHPDVVLVDTGSYLCPGGEPRDQVNGVTLRDDGVHFSRQGGAIVWRQLLMPAITAGLTARSPNRSTALLVGDSVPLGLSKRFPTGDYPDLRVLDDTLLGCSAFSTPSVVDGTAKPMDPECSTWSASIPATLDRINPQVGLVFVGIGEQYDKLVDGEVIAFGTSAHDEWLADNLRQRIGLFRDRDIPVVVVTSPCHRVIDITETADSKIINDDTRVRRNNRVLTDVAGDYPTGVSVVDLHHELCPDGFEPVVDGVRLYEDGLHFNDQGAALVWSILVPAIEAARTS